MAAGYGTNYTLSQALAQYNADQVLTTNMWYLEFFNLPAIEEEVIKKSQIYGKGFTLPGRTNTYESVNYRGYEIPTPINLQMAHQHSIDIIADAGGWLRSLFLRWQARSIDPRITNQETSFAADRRPMPTEDGLGAAASLRVNLLAPNMVDVPLAVDIFGVRVESVGDITLTNDAGGIATFQVQFQSVYWETIYGKNYIDASSMDPGWRAGAFDLNINNGE